MATHQQHHTADALAEPTSRVAGLARKLARCRARSTRLWRMYQAIDEKLRPDASTAAHLSWSDTIDEALGIAEAISRQRPRDIAELAMQFEALWWWLVEDDSILDGSARRWLGRFRRALRHLAATK